MTGDKKLQDFLKKPNTLALLPGLFLGPLITSIITGTVFWLIFDPAYLVYAAGGFAIGVLGCIFAIPTVFRYQKTKTHFIRACTLLALIVTIILAPIIFLLIATTQVLNPNLLVLIIFIILYGTLTGFITVLIYTLCMQLLFKRYRASS